VSAAFKGFGRAFQSKRAVAGDLFAGTRLVIR